MGRKSAKKKCRKKKHERKKFFNECKIKKNGQKKCKQSAEQTNMSGKSALKSAKKH